MIFDQQALSKTERPIKPLRRLADVWVCQFGNYNGVGDRTISAA